METLQTIWTALTTPNEVLTSILVLPMYFIEAYISMLLFTLILNISSTRKQKTLYVLIMTIASIISRTFIPTPYNTYINIMTMILSIMLIFRVNILKAILALFMPYFAIAIIESIVAKMYFSIFNFDYILGMHIPINRFIATLLIYSVLFILYLIIKYFKSKIPKFEILSKKHRILLSLTIIFGIILIATQLYITFFYSNFLPLIIVIISIGSLLAYFLISIYTVFTVSKLETTSTSLEESQLYNKTLQILHDNIRAFKHDFWNIVQGIGGYV